jgi:Tol biopolymer transport system component
VVNADGSGQRLLAARGLNPAWSPDGEQVAFQRTVAAPDLVNGRLCTVRTWLINQDGSNERQLAELNEGCGVPVTWSPDGTRLANVFISGHGTPGDETWRFAISMVDGSAPPVLLGDAYGSWQPVAAPLPPVTSSVASSSAP